MNTNTANLISKLLNYLEDEGNPEVIVRDFGIGFGKIKDFVMQDEKLCIIVDLET